MNFFSDNHDFTLKPNSHTEAVLSLSWNRVYRNLIASASADKTVKLWDLANETCVNTYTYHTDKVQAVSWNPAESSILATGSFDKRICILDVRNPQTMLSTELNGDIETLAWLPSPHHNHLLASDESGYLYCYDILKGLNQPLWSIQAHNKPCQAIAVNPVIPGLIVTGSPEHENPIKFWDIADGYPVCLYAENNSSIGMVFSLNFSVDDPYYLVVGNKSDEPVLINSIYFDPIKNKYGNQNWVHSETIKPSETPLQVADI